jgi:urea transport system substrate-binding protein
MCISSGTRERGNHRGGNSRHVALDQRDRASRAAPFEGRGHFVAWNYLHAFDTPENRAFIAEWRRFTGKHDAVTNDPMEATLNGFSLWAAAVEAAETADVDKVRLALGGRRFTAPSGFSVLMDGKTHHLSKPVMIGRITEDGRILPVSVTEGLVPPDPWSPWLRRSGSRPQVARLQHQALGA